MHNIAGMFAQGDFSLPVFIHDTVPAGVVVNEAFKGSNRVYSREYRQGGEVRIATRNTGALVAVHEFLRFQTKDDAPVTRW